MNELYRKLQALKQKNKDFNLFVYIIEFIEDIIKFISPFASAQDFNGDIDFDNVKDGDLFYVEQKEEFIEVDSSLVKYADKIEETEEYKNNPLREYINNDYTINYDRILEENGSSKSTLFFDNSFLSDVEISKRINFIGIDNGSYLENKMIVLFNDTLMSDDEIPKSIKENGNFYYANVPDNDMLDYIRNNSIILHEQTYINIGTYRLSINNVQYNGRDYYINITIDYLPTYTGHSWLIPIKMNKNYFFNGMCNFIKIVSFHNTIDDINTQVVVNAPSYDYKSFDDIFVELLTNLKIYLLSNKYKYYLIYDQGNFRIINENPNIAYIRNKDLDVLIKLFVEEDEIIISKQELHNKFHVSLNNGYIGIIDTNKLYNCHVTMDIKTFCEIKYKDENNVKLILKNESSSMGDSEYLTTVFIGEFED